MTQRRRKKAARVRLGIAIGLGLASIGGSLPFAVADTVRGSVNWAHHSPASAAPLFLIAGAIAAVSIGRPPQGRHALLRLVAVLAFTAWGTAQLMPSPAAAGVLNDAAILLFVIDGGCVVVNEARAILAQGRQTAQSTPPRRTPADSQPGSITARQRDNRTRSHGPVMLRKTHAAACAAFPGQTLTGAALHQAEVTVTRMSARFDVGRHCCRPLLWSPAD